MDSPKNVLILCTRNTARSQMAEALVRKYAGKRFNVYSAGLEPDPVHPLVEPVMNEIGVDISDQYSKDVGVYLGRLTVHHLIIVCDQVEKNCPKLFPGALRHHYWPFDDPAAIVGSQAATLEKFRTVRDEIDTRIKQWLEDE